MMIPIMLGKLLLVVLFAIVINLPLGYWREGLKKFSLLWIFAIHASIPFVIAFRYAIGLTYSAMPIYVTAPVVIGSAVVGQIIGSRTRRRDLELRNGAASSSRSRDSELTSGAASSSHSRDSELTSGAASSSRSRDSELTSGAASSSRSRKNS